MLIYKAVKDVNNPNAMRVWISQQMGCHRLALTRFDVIPYSSTDCFMWRSSRAAQRSHLTGLLVSFTPLADAAYEILKGVRENM